MPGEVVCTSLLDHVAETGYRASIITTYSCYFPFYEDVVLRRLMAGGCTHNVLMVDAARCAEAFAIEELRPRRAGRDYTLIPVNIGGVFHPKLILRVGRSKGSILVGSHNMTLSGFGLNDEVTNALRLEGAALRERGALLRQAFDYLAGYVPASLPDVVDAFDSVKRDARWLDGPLGPVLDDWQLLTQSSTGPNLWSKVAPLIPKDVTTAFISGPFFDPSLAMLRRLQEYARPRRLVVGIDPESVDIDPLVAATLEGVEWVNAAGVPAVPQRREGASRKLHAKLFWFTNELEELLITGSANPSVAAFFAGDDVRNAEAVVARRDKGAARKLGMEALLGAPAVTPGDWDRVTERRKTAMAATNGPSQRIFIATPSPIGFLTQVQLPVGLMLRAAGDMDLELGEATAREGCVIDASDDVRVGARYLEARDDHVHTLVVVHRTEDIARNLGGDARKALRQALGALEEDPAQLEALLKLTEQVIFDSDDIVRIAPLRSTAGPDAESAPATMHASLSLSAVGRSSSAKRARKLASGDIAVLLDALVRRLGEGLTAMSFARSPGQEEVIGYPSDHPHSSLRRSVALTSPPS